MGAKPRQTRRSAAISLLRRHQMSYYFSKTLDLSYDDAVDRAIEELKKEGFGI